MKEFDGIVFDMDGVIFDSEWAKVECWKEVAEKYKIEGSEKIIEKCIGVYVGKVEEMMKAHYGNDFPFNQYFQEMMDLCEIRFGDGKMPLKKGIREILEALKQSNKKIAIASSSEKAFVMRQVERAHLTDYFDKIICGDMVKKSKPDPDIYLTACKELEISPEKAYAIEDSHNGIKAASRAGMMPIMVPDLLPETEEMRELAVMICEDLIEVKETILPCSHS